MSNGEYEQAKEEYERDILLGQGILSKLSPQEFSWLKTFYGKEPWIKEKLSVLQRTEPQYQEALLGDLKDTLATIIETRVLELIDTFEVSEFSPLQRRFLRDTWRYNETLRDLLVAICIWKEIGDAEKELRHLGLLKEILLQLVKEPKAGQKFFPELDHDLSLELFHSYLLPMAEKLSSFEDLGGAIHATLEEMAILRNIVAKLNRKEVVGLIDSLLGKKDFKSYHLGLRRLKNLLYPGKRGR